MIKMNIAGGIRLRMNLLYSIFGFFNNFRFNGLHPQVKDSKNTPSGWHPDGVFFIKVVVYLSLFSKNKIDLTDFFLFIS